MNHILLDEEEPIWDVLAARLCPAEDGQDEGSRLVGMEGGRDDHVFSRLQREQLHHPPGVHVGFSLGDGGVGAEERGCKFPPVSLILRYHRSSQFSNSHVFVA